MNVFKQDVASSSIRLVLSILDRRDRFLIFIVALIQIFLGILDLIGIALIGVVGSLAVTGISSQARGNSVSRVLDLLRLSENTIQYQVSALGLIAAFSLTSKTLISLLLTRKTLFFLAHKGASISSELIYKFFSRPLTTLNIRSTHGTIYALTSGVNLIMTGVIGAWISLLSDLTLLMIIGFGLFFVDVITSVVVLVIFGGVAFLLFRLLSEKVKLLGLRQSEFSIRSSELISEAIHGYRELTVRDKRSYYASEIASRQHSLADGTASSVFLRNISKYVLEIVMVGTSLSLAAFQFSANSASRAVATVGIFLAASGRIVPAILRIQQSSFGVKSSLSAARPTIELIREIGNLQKVEMRNSPNSKKYEGFDGSASLDRVSFRYDSGEWIFKDLSVNIEPGEFVGIVGESGAGKTTFVDVLLGTIEPIEGSVRISKLEPLETYRKWPGAVSYVPQDAFIVNGSIRDNICLGFPRAEVSDEECWESLRIARLEELVMSFKEGLDHLVGERGTKLSGGQRQRLGIARAMISKPRFLILDEATSSLDSVTESEISNSIRDLKGKVTLIVVAHRLSTLLDADRLIYFEKGKSPRSGSFKDLQKSNSRFEDQVKKMGLSE
jgi:ATP-binding cassette, subfamily B, bacterial PglK